MISRILLPLLILLLLPDLYFHFRKRRRNIKRRLLFALPSIALAVYAISLALTPHFAPKNIAWLNWFLLLLGLYAIPRFLYALCTAIGFTICRLSHRRVNWGKLAGFILAILCIYIVLYGTFFGTDQMKVRHAEFTSADLPASFDGYRIALFADAHVGSSAGNKGIANIQMAVDSILAQEADMIVFAGDLENMQPSEIDPVQPELSRLHAIDGVYSVLGNHDYAMYLKADSLTSALNEQLIQSKERSMGWTLLMNENRIIRRGNDSIFVAGMENLGQPPFPKKGDLEATLKGVHPKAFTLLLQHDPTAWRQTILPQSHAQLTLSGHTHGAQFSLFGWSPASMVYDEWGGMYHELKRALYVTTGIGGFVPFRFGMPPEVVIITLHSSKP